ncbi:RHS repeat-associated core domain-containing protein [Pseudolactococcus yaeyamensis]
MKATDREAQLRLEESDITLSDILTKLVKMPEFLARCLPIKDRTWRIDHDVNRRKVTEEKLKKAVDTTVMIDTIEYLNDYTQTYVSPLQEQYTTYDKKVKSSYQATNIYDTKGMAIGNDLDTYHQDGLKSNITQISKKNGRLYSSNLYQEFGSSERRIQDQAGYRSQYHDNSADIHLRAREYNTNTGRFLQQDTVLGSLNNPTTQNKYIYGNNNPFMYRDDAGRFGWNDVWNGIKKAAKKAVQIVNKYVVQPVVKVVKDLITSKSGGNPVSAGYDTYSTTGTPTIYYNSSGQQVVSSQLSPYISPATQREIDRAAAVAEAKRQEQEKKIRADRIRKLCEAAKPISPSDKQFSSLEDYWDMYFGMQRNGVDPVTGKKYNPAINVVIQASFGMYDAYENGWLDLALMGYMSAKSVGKTPTAPTGVGNPVKVVGKGNTGRVVANNLNEQLAMKEVMSAPLSNATELTNIKLNDTRWHHSDGWVKMQNIVRLNNGEKVNIHFVYNKNTGQFDDFKFK